MNRELGIDGERNLHPRQTIETVVETVRSVAIVNGIENKNCIVKSSNSRRKIRDTLDQ